MLLIEQVRYFYHLKSVINQNTDRTKKLTKVPNNDFGRRPKRVGYQRSWRMGKHTQLVLFVRGFDKLFHVLQVIFDVCYKVVHEGHMIPSFVEVVNN